MSEIALKKATKLYLIDQQCLTLLKTCTGGLGVLLMMGHDGLALSIQCNGVPQNCREKYD